MSAKRKVAMPALVLIFVLMATVGIVAFRSQWHQDGEPTAFYEDAGKSMPVLEALAQEHVTFLRVQDWCQAYSDNRERRANTLRSTCTLEDNYKLFDNTSQTRFAELKGKLKPLPYGVRWIEILYGPDGTLRAAELSIDTINPFKRDALVYRPGYTLPVDIPNEVVHHRIDADWYYRWEDWN